MNCGAPTPAQCVPERETRRFQRTLIHEINGAVSLSAPDMRRNGVDSDAKVPLVLPDPVFRPLCRGDVHDGSNKLDAARFLAYGMSHYMDIFDGTIRHHQAIFMIKILPILGRALDGLFHEGRVFRVNPLENEFHGRFRHSVVLEDAKGLLRPEDLAG